MRIETKVLDRLTGLPRGVFILTLMAGFSAAVVAALAVAALKAPPAIGSDIGGPVTAKAYESSGTAIGFGRWELHTSRNEFGEECRDLTLTSITVPEANQGYTMGACGGSPLGVTVLAGEAGSVMLGRANPGTSKITLTRTDSSGVANVEQPALITASTGTVYFVTSAPVPVASISMSAVGPDGVETFHQTYAWAN